MTNENYNYYKGYELDIPIYELTDRKIRVLDNACDLVDNNWSLRVLSSNVCRSKSALQRDLSITLRKLSYDLYGVVRRTLRNHRV